MSYLLILRRVPIRSASAYWRNHFNKRLSERYSIPMPHCFHAICLGAIKTGKAKLIEKGSTEIYAVDCKIWNRRHLIIYCCYDVLAQYVTSCLSPGGFE